MLKILYTQARWVSRNRWPSLLPQCGQSGFIIHSSYHSKKMSRTRSADEGIKHATWIVHPLLSALGAWPVNATSSVLSKSLKWCLIFLTYFLQFAVMIPSTLFVILKVKNGRNRIKLIMPHFNSACQLCKYTVLLRRSNEFRKLLDDLKEDWSNATKEDQWILRTKSSIGHKVMMSIGILIYTGGVSLRTIIPLLKGKIVLPNNMTIRRLPCPGYFVFFNEQRTPNYEIIFVLQVVCGLVNYTTLCGTVGLCAMLCLHMCSMLRILANRMIELSNQSNTDEKAVQEKVIDIVERQIKIKRWVVFSF